MQLVPHSDIRRNDDRDVAAHDVPRAGLRTPPTGAPTGAFVVVEMTILVVVIALAMVSVIVASGDDNGRDRVAFAIDARSPSVPDVHADAPSRTADARRVGDAR